MCKISYQLINSLQATIFEIRMITEFNLMIGITEINFRINEKPKAGRVTVSISPGSGIAYETKFSVSARGFTDYEDGSTMSFYKFGYRIDPDSLITWFHEGSAYIIFSSYCFKIFVSSIKLKIIGNSIGYF